MIRWSTEGTQPQIYSCVGCVNAALWLFARGDLVFNALLVTHFLVYQYHLVAFTQGHASAAVHLTESSGLIFSLSLRLLILHTD